MSPEYATVRELYEQVEKVDARMGRLEKVVIALVVAVASPKVGGPDPAALISSVVHLF